MKIAIKREVIKLLADVTYAHVPYWFNLTMMDLKMDILMPKESKSHEKQPLIVWCCGGGFTVMDRHIWIPELVEYARRGYVVVEGAGHGTEQFYQEEMVDIVDHFIKNT